MFYGVAVDADITTNRIHRFCKQMTLSQRSQRLLNGLLLVNEGNYGESPTHIRAAESDNRPLCLCAWSFNDSQNLKRSLH